MRNRWIWLTILICVIGATLQVARYARGLSYWCDEVSLLTNVRNYELARLLNGPLDAVPATQAAPPVFLAACKAAFQYLGPGEYAMRLAPLCATLALLAAFACLAWRLLDPPAATFAVALMAFSDRIIFHAATVKQYGWDALATTLILIAALTPTRQSLLLRRWRVVLVASLLIWASHPVVFVGGAVLLAMGLASWSRGRPALRRDVLRIAIGFGFSCLALYVLSIRVQRDDMLADFWTESGAFANWGRPWTIPGWYLLNTLEVLRYPLRAPGWMILPLIGFGFIALFVRSRTTRRHTLTGPILLAVLLLTGLAGVAGFYPYQGKRLALFLAPVTFLCAGFGLQCLISRATTQMQAIKPWVRRTGIMVSTLAVTWCAALAGYRFIHPEFDSDLHPAIEFVHQHAGNEPIYALNRDDAEIARFYLNGRRLVSLDANPLQPANGEAYWILLSTNHRNVFDKESAEYLRNHAGNRDMERSFFRVGGNAIRFTGD